MLAVLSGDVRWNLKEIALSNVRSNQVIKLDSLPGNTTRPLYRQIQESILHKIHSGEWVLGEKIPSENVLVRDLGVSRMTINRALRELNQQGYLERVPGVGTFVKEPPHHASLINIQNISEEIQARGHRHRAELSLLDYEQAASGITDQMELPRGAKLFHAMIVHHENGIPIQLEDRYVNPKSAPEFMNVDFSRITPTQYLIGLFRPDEMEHIVRAISPEKSVAEILAIPAGEPCLKLSRRTWVNGVVVTFANFTYPSSRYDLSSRYSTEKLPRDSTN